MTDLSKLSINRTVETPKAPASGGWRQPWVVGAAVATLVLAVVLISWESENQSVPAEVSPSSTEPPRTAISFNTVLNATGYVVAQRQAAVSSKATGRLKELNVVEGDTVKSGEIIGVLENADMQAALRQTEANVGALEARVNSVRAELYEAQRLYERQKLLVTKGAASKAEFDQAEARFKRADAELSSSSANLELGRAQLDRARVDLDYTFIKAPFDGTVLTKNAEVGEIVAPFGSSANARAAVVTIADMQSLQVEADVSEANIAKVYIGQPAEITLDAFPERKYRGEVIKIVPTVDRAKATVLTKIKFLEIDNKVLPEMSAKVALALKTE